MEVLKAINAVFGADLKFSAVFIPEIRQLFACEFITSYNNLFIDFHVVIRRRDGKYEDMVLYEDVLLSSVCTEASRSAVLVHCAKWL